MAAKSFASDATAGVPTTLQAQLIWAGTAQGWVSFGTSGHAAGDVYALGLLAPVVTSEGDYAWSVEVQATLPGGATIDQTIGGTAHLAYNGACDALGYDTSTATVSNPPVTASGGFTVTAVEGNDSGLQTVATFADPGGPEINADGSITDYGALINWSDGTPATVGRISYAGNGMFVVQGHHTYKEESAADHPGSNPYIITVTLGHESAPTSTATSKAVVSDPAVMGTGGFTVYALEGLDSGSQQVASFTDPGGPEAVGDYAATIAWGDGISNSGTIGANSDGFVQRLRRSYLCRGRQLHDYRHAGA